MFDLDFLLSSHLKPILDVVLPLLVGFNIAMFIVILFLRRWDASKQANGKRRKKLLAVLGSGGHTTEMLKLLSTLDTMFAERVYVCAETDKMSLIKVQAYEQLHQNMHFVRTIPRSREVKQSYFTSIWTTIVATIASIKLFLEERPDIVLCNGPGTCLPLCLIARFFHLIFFHPCRIVFVESLCRVQYLSLTGKILYLLRVTPHFLVQWPELAEKYPRARYLGRLV